MIYCPTQGLQSIYYNDYKWSITFKNCESLCFTPGTYIILCINYTQFKKLKIKILKNINHNLKIRPKQLEKYLQILSSWGRHGQL